jgi:hypothetical protein
MLTPVSNPASIHQKQVVMSIKHIVAATAAVAAVGFGAVAGAVSFSESATATTTPEMGSVQSWGSLLATAPQPEFRR